MKKILVIDGQGGGIGKAIIQKIKEENLSCQVYGIGTNSIATSSMKKAGADIIATGENAIIYNSKKVDVIVGPIGVIIANSLYGEITEKIAVSVSESDAMKVLIPFNNCNVQIVGVSSTQINDLLNDAIEKIKNILV